MIFIVDLFLQRIQQTYANRWPTVNAWRLFLKLLYIDIMYCFRCATLIVCLFSLLYLFSAMLHWRICFYSNSFLTKTKKMQVIINASVAQSYRQLFRNSHVSFCGFFQWCDAVAFQFWNSMFSI